MKILALTSEFPPFVGGIGTYAAELARAATELGHEIVLAAPDYGGDHKPPTKQITPMKSSAILVGSIGQKIFRPRSRL
jgi:glycogen synthase